jgi:hypothetical protein
MMQHVCAMTQWAKEDITKDYVGNTDGIFSLTNTDKKTLELMSVRECNRFCTRNAFIFQLFTGEYMLQLISSLV